MLGRHPKIWIQTELKGEENAKNNLEKRMILNIFPRIYEEQAKGKENGE